MKSGKQRFSVLLATSIQPKSVAAYICVFVAVATSGPQAIAQSHSCDGPGHFTGVSGDAWHSGTWNLSLPSGVDEVSCSVTTDEFDLENDVERPGQISYRSIDPLKFEYDTDGEGPYEATVSVEFIPIGFPDNSESWPLGLVNSGHLERGTFTDGTNSPTMLNLPVSVYVGRSVWEKSKIFDGSYFSILAAYEDRFFGWVVEQPVSHPPDSYRLKLEFTMTLRRIKGQCYMRTIVSGGRGAGVYSGDVAVFGSPTGVSNETLESWFGSPEDTAEGGRFQALQSAMNSQMGQQARQGMSAEQQRLLERAYEEMGAAARQADPINEVRQMVTLTLEDIRFNEQGPSADRGDTMAMAMAHIANKFVLSAQLELVGDADPLSVEESYSVEKVGLKGPGLGLASSHTDKCPANLRTLTLRSCPGQTQQDGFYCGTLDAQVCNETNDLLTLKAEFQAASSLEDCIQ